MRVVMLVLAAIFLRFGVPIAIAILSGVEAAPGNWRSDEWMRR